MAVTRDVKYMNETAFRHECKEILDDEENITVNLFEPNGSHKQDKKKEIELIVPRTRRVRRDDSMLRKVLEV
ncbi:unnamed protein product [Colias eurytheme]|nr:unnamed protein product [Colias eurytheme]